MILINSGKMTIPEEERFIGFAGDNLHSTKQFLVSGVADENCIYRLYLTFDDGTTNYFVLDSKVEKDSTILNWTILEEHIFKSGMVEAQIKSISADGEVYHTSSDYFFVAYSAELFDEFKGNENAEFLRYEKELNELLKKLESGAHDCVKENRTIARLPLSDDIEDVELMRALSVYPVFLTDVGPEEFNISGIGTGQFRLVQRSNTDDTCTLYNYRGVDENGKNIWLKVACDSDVSDEQISAAVDKYLSNNPIGDTGADGKSAYQIALDNGFEGTELEWLDSLKGEDGEDGISPSITVSKTDGGTVLTIVSDAGIQKTTILNGDDGNDGTSISIDNINESADDDGNNIITFSDGNTLSIKNGSKGSQGEKGEKGDKGDTGAQGKDGSSASITVSETSTGYRLLVSNEGGSGGANVSQVFLNHGEKGADGYTPIKGVDYYTEDEKAQLVNEVIDTMNSADAITVYETVGGYYSTDGSFIEDENFSCKHTDIISVEKNEKFSYTGCGVWSAASVLWYDENSVLISASQYGEWDNEATLEITVPSGVSYARFCSFANVGEVVFSISRLESDTIHSVLKGKKIVYDGDSICYGAGYKGGYAKLLAEAVYGSYE
ncbi:MAG: collagen-like protein, partial [Ruminococcus sp.]|nr:collagen-like protein [Ruminococcus sp.]